MNPFFKLPHIFVVFAPGAGGNFLVGLLSKIINNDLAETIKIAQSGSSHTVLDLAITRILAMQIQQEFKTVEEKIKFYKEKITEIFYNTNIPQVAWSHDFTSIPLYHTVFPNSKIIVITQETMEEQLIVTFMHVTKNLMDPTGVSYFDLELLEKMQHDWKELCTQTVATKYPRANIPYVFANSDAVKYLYLQQILDDEIPSKIIRDSVTNKPLDLDEYLTDYCILLPYSYISNKNLFEFINIIGQVLARELTHQEQDFINTNFVRYVNLQEQQVLSDPKMYYADLKNKAFNIISASY